jgi:hypothetical protein
MLRVKKPVTKLQCVGFMKQKACHVATAGFVTHQKLAYTSS